MATKTGSDGGGLPGEPPNVEVGGTGTPGVPTTGAQVKWGLGIAIGLGVIVILVGVLKYGFKLF
jgi:hypothetical protein